MRVGSACYLLFYYRLLRLKYFYRWLSKEYFYQIIFNHTRTFNAAVFFCVWFYLSILEEGHFLNIWFVILTNLHWRMTDMFLTNKYSAILVEPLRNSSDKLSYNQTITFRTEES